MNELRTFDPFAIEPFDQAFRNFMKPWKFEAEVAPHIKIDVTEKDDSFGVKAEIPGVKKEDIDVRVEGNLVTISAEVNTEKEEKDDGRVLRRERHQGWASRSFTLGCPVDEGKVQAKYDSGVLSLTLPKKASASNKRIAIE